MSVHQFADYLKRSKTQEQIATEIRKLGEIPLFRGHRFVATESDVDRLGGDYEVTAPDGRVQYVDVKFRHTDVSTRWRIEPDVTIEWWSVLEAKKPGWTVKDGGLTDLIAYMWRDDIWPDSFVFEFRRLREAARRCETEWANRFGKHHVPNSGYTTVCSFVPVSVVNHAMAEVGVARTNKPRRLLPHGKIDLQISWHDHARLIRERYGSDESEQLAYQVLRENSRQTQLF